MRTRRGYHNTNQAGPQLMIVYNRDALADQDMVLEVLQKFRQAAWFEVHACLPWMNEDSLKRSLSDLQDAGILIMDTDKANLVMGPYGKRCHRYKLVKKQEHEYSNRKKLQGLQVPQGEQAAGTRKGEEAGEVSSRRA